MKYSLIIERELLDDPANVILKNKPLLILVILDILIMFGLNYIVLGGELWKKKTKI